MHDTNSEQSIVMALMKHQMGLRDLSTPFTYISTTQLKL
jgi:hypothetical protein